MSLNNQYQQHLKWQTAIVEINIFLVKNAWTMYTQYISTVYTYAQCIFGPVSHTIRDVQNVDNKQTLNIKRHQIPDRSYTTYRQ